MDVSLLAQELKMLKSLNRPENPTHCPHTFSLSISPHPVKVGHLGPYYMYLLAMLPASHDSLHLIKPMSLNGLHHPATFTLLLVSKKTGTMVITCFTLYSFSKDSIQHHWKYCHFFLVGIPHSEISISKAPYDHRWCGFWSEQGGNRPVSPRQQVEKWDKL